MDQALDYEQLKPQHYLNTNPVGMVSGHDVYLHEIVAGALGAGLNLHFRGPKSSGKTQLMRDIFNGWFNGEEYGLWEMGRSDFKPSDLFKKLNLSKARGTIENMPEIKAVYSAGSGVEYLIRSSVEQDGDFKLVWKRISAEEKKDIEADYSVTTADLKELRNLDTKFFAIDEFNRCPQVVMNLFYGLMTGEINEDGEIVKLGDGYYTGIAASNPDDYDGTFTMDPAMWARWHIVVDFGAYTPSEEDVRILRARNLSPGVQTADLGDLTQAIEALHERISSEVPTLIEHVTLHYLQSGLQHCSSEDVMQTNKELFYWPQTCYKEECEKKTTLCGMLRGIDPRASAATFRLAKGISEVLKLREGSDARVDEIDAIVLAYQFVAPYKGSVSRRAAKENKNIEGLVVRDAIETITQNVREKLDEVREIAQLEGRIVLGSVEELKRELGAEYDSLEEVVREKYEVEVLLGVEDLRKEYSEEFTKREVEQILEREEIVDFTKETLKVMEPDKYKEIKALEPVSLDQYSGNEPYEEHTRRLRREERRAVDEFARVIVEESPLREGFYSKYPRVREEIEAKIASEFNSSPQRVIPDSKREMFEAELRRTLREKVREKKQAAFASRKKQLFADEWFFLRQYYNEFLGE